MVENIDSKDVAGSDNLFCRIEVFLARVSRSGRMVVRDDNAVSIAQQSSFEYLTGMNKACRYAELGITAIIPS